MGNPRVFMDITIGNKPASRIIIELFTETTPLTAQFFRSLCTAKNSAKLHYKGTSFHHVDPRIIFAGVLDNVGQQVLQSIYGATLKPENFVNKHDGPGVVSMLDPHDTHFSITTTTLPAFDGQLVVVGKVVEGIDVVNAVANMQDLLLPVVIADCGELSMANPRVYMDITIGGESSNRIVIELFAETTPRMAEIFRALCSGENSRGIHYKGNAFHRVVYDVCQDQGVLISAGNHELESIYSTEAENFFKKHDRAGTVSVHSQGPSFFISTMELSQLDGKHVVIGHVVEGLNFVVASMRSSLPIVIADCGELR